MSSPAATTTATRHGPWRWFVALIATVLLVVSGSGLVVFAASGDAEGKGPRFVSAEAPIYVEARLDLPGDQREALAQVLTAFPLFGDANSFDMKVDQAIDDVLGQMTDGAISFSGELEDVITGEIGLAVTDFEPMMMNEEPGFLVGIAHSDAEGARSYVDLLLAGVNAEGDLSEETYGDTTILSDPSSAVAVHDEWVLLSQDVEQVKAGIDALEGTIPNLADDPEFQVAFSRLPSPRLGAAYMDFSAFGSLFEMAGMMAAGQTGMDMPTTDLMAALPVDMAMSLSAANDRVHLHAFITPGPGTPAVSVGESDLAGLFPSDTQIYLETRDLGATVETTLEQLADAMAAQSEAMGEGSQLDQIELLFSEDSPITSMLGVPLSEFFGFLGDTAVGASLTSDGIGLGMAAVVDDEETAAARVERLMSILRLAGASEDSGIVIEEVTVAGATGTAITLPIEQAGADALPFPVDDTITVVVADGHLLLGLGDFVETALAQPSVDSLASSAGYTDALAGDSPNSGVLYANVSALLTSIDPLLSMMIPEWSEIQPFATGLDRMIAVGTADEEVVSTRMTVIVDQ